MVRTKADCNDEMPAQIDFSKGTRGKYAKPDAKLKLPVYLEQEVQGYLAARAECRGIAIEPSSTSCSRKTSSLSRLRDRLVRGRDV